jgi:hypothetical protein
MWIAFYFNAKSQKELFMKKQTRKKCETCSRPITVIIRGKNGTEKLCSQCLVVHYPALRELTKVI